MGMPHFEMQKLKNKLQALSRLERLGWAALAPEMLAF